MPIGVGALSSSLPVMQASDQHSEALREAARLHQQAIEQAAHQHAVGVCVLVFEIQAVAVFFCSFRFFSFLSREINFVPVSACTVDLEGQRFSE